MHFFEEMKNILKEKCIVKLGYMSYVTQKIQKDGTLKITPEIVDVIIDGMTDKNTKIREAAYSTWVSIVELESDKITKDMIEKVAEALKTYS